MLLCPFVVIYTHHKRFILAVDFEYIVQLSICSAAFEVLNYYVSSLHRLFLSNLQVSGRRTVFCNWNSANPSEAVFHFCGC